MLRAIPTKSRTRPATVNDRPRRLTGCHVKLYGIMRNHAGFSVFARVISSPPTKYIEPAVIMKYPTVSLCLDSSAFSCKYSLKSIKLPLFEHGLDSSIRFITDSEYLQRGFGVLSLYQKLYVCFVIVRGLRCRSRMSVAFAAEFFHMAILSAVNDVASFIVETV